MRLDGLSLPFGCWSGQPRRPDIHREATGFALWAGTLVRFIALGWVFRGGIANVDISSVGLRQAVGGDGKE